MKEYLGLEGLEQLAKSLDDKYEPKHERVQVKVVNKSRYPLPEYKHLGDSGLDIRADISEPITLRSLERFAVPTGIYVQLPENYEIQVRPRSGLAAKYGISVLNSPGTVDEAYIGEIKVILVNLSNDPFTIEPGERIAQLVLAKVEKLDWDEVLFLTETDRGDSGFGSTGRV